MSKVIELKAKLFDIRYTVDQLKTQEQNLMKELQIEILKEQENPKLSESEK